MSSTNNQIHLKEGTIPKTRHNPVPVPFHFKELVKRALWEMKKRVSQPQYQLAYLLIGVA